MLLLKKTPLILALIFLLNTFTESSAVNRKDQIWAVKSIISDKPDSALLILNELEKDITAPDNQRFKLELLQLKSDAYRHMQGYSKSYDLSKQALDIAIDLADTLILIEAYTHYGFVCSVVFQEAETMENFEKALALRKIMHAKEMLSSKNLMHGYRKNVQGCIRFQKYYDAIHYLDTCYLLADKYSFNNVTIAYLDVTKAFLLINNNEIERALHYLKKSKDFFEGIESDKYYFDHKSYLPTVYSHLANVYRLKGKYALSKKYFDMSLEGLKKYTFHHNHKPYVLEKYAWLLYETGEYEKATEYLNESKRLSEYYFKAKALSNDEFQIIQNRYQGELNQRIQQLIEKSLIISKKDKILFRFRIAAFMTIALSIITILVYRSIKTSRKYKAEKKQIEEKEYQAKELLKLKNRELTESTLKQIEKDEIISILTNELKKYPTKNSEVLLKSIDHSSDKMWDDFNNRFKAVNQDFYKKLNSKFPNLTSNDMRICALIKLNFSTKEMARLLGISTDSAQKARHRLRKKLNVNRDVNLVNFISSM